MAKKLDFLIAKVTAVKSVLAKELPNNKQNHVGIQLAQQFNNTLDELAAELGDDSGHLPQKINMSDRAGLILKQAGKAPLSFLDLEILVEQVLSVLDVIKQDG